MKTYIAKPNTWFKEGTIAELKEYLHIDGDGVKYGLFEGSREKDGAITIESEVCSYEDFQIMEIPNPESI